MIIRRFRTGDSAAVSELAIETFSRYCSGDYFDPSAVDRVLYAWDCKTNPEFINDMDRTDIYFVALDPDGSCAGLVRGTKDKLNSLFVCGCSHRHGTGRLLMQKFEAEARKQGSTEIRLNSSLYAAGFYERIGFTRLSGITDFEGLKVYPMVKLLD